MASLQTLRNKGGVIVASVIGLALLSFVLGDLLTSGSTLFGGGQNVGEINGTKITVQQFQNQVNTLTEVVKMSTGSQTVTEEQNQMILDEAWEQLVLQYSTTPALNKVGISVTPTEVAELITGDNVSPTVQQLFSDQNGFNSNLVRQFLANIDQDPTGRMEMFWNNLENDVRNESQMNKFRALVDKGTYVTEAQAKFIAGLEGANYNVRMVAEKLTSIADSTVTVSDSEIKDFYNANQKAFKRPESRGINYVVFDALPSESDYRAAEKYISSLKEEFESATDVKQFASLNSNEAFDARYYREGELSGELNSFAFSADKDAIYAPEIAADEYVLARISDKKFIADSIDLAHILLDPANPALADSINKVIASNPSKFNALAAEFSLDQQTAQNNGQIGTVDPQVLPEEFTKQLLAMKKGQVKLITLPTSLHIVKVNDIIGGSEKVQLGTIKYKVEASEDTRALTFNKASNFVANAKSSDFATVAADSMLSVRNASLNSKSKELQGYDNSRQAVRWTYAAETGDVSDVMEFGNSYIVATLSSINEEGIAPLSDVKAGIERVVKGEKKGKMIAEKMNGSVDELAAKLGSEVIEGEAINFTTYIAPVIGFDQPFAGGVVALKKGETSKPIVGKQAVYTVEVTDVVSNPVSTEQIRERLSAELQQGTFYKAYQTMQENSNISDERYKFF